MKTYKIRKPRPIFFLVLAVLVAIPFTVFASLERYGINSFAEIPPLFYCLSVGESNNQQCASFYFEAETSLALHGFTLTNKKNVYYGDTLTGTATYKNTGDLPLAIKDMGIAAYSKKTKARVDFSPQPVNETVPPGKSITIAATSHTFNGPKDPGGDWEVFMTLTKADGQKIDDIRKTKIKVNAICTAFRARPLTAKDKSNIKAMCAKNPNSKVCLSSQYCEIIQGKDDCPPPAPDTQMNANRCDEWVVLAEGEQNMLEELCKAYPGTDTCKTFCDRTINSPLCQDDYIAASRVPASRMAPPQNQLAQIRSVAGAKTLLALMSTTCTAGQQKNSNTGECCASQAPLTKEGCCSPACGYGNKQPAAPAGTGTPIAPPGKPGAPAPPGQPAAPAAPAKPACASGCFNNPPNNQCCKICPVGANGLCQKPNAAGTAPVTRDNCQPRDNGSTCCATGATAVGGTCTGGDQAAPQAQPPQVPPPQAQPPQAPSGLNSDQQKSYNNCVAYCQMGPPGPGLDTCINQCATIPSVKKQ